MRRFAAIVAFAGAVIVSTRILAPAEPPLARPPVVAAELAFIGQAAPILDQVDGQVKRLRERLAAPPPFPKPTRDPFRFGTRVEPSRPKPAPAPQLVVEPIAAPKPVLPKLVAIASTMIDGAPTRTAVLTTGDDIQIVKVGDTILMFVIRSIGVDAIEIADPFSGATFRLSLH